MNRVRIGRRVAIWPQPAYHEPQTEYVTENRFLPYQNNQRVVKNETYVASGTVYAPSGNGAASCCPPGAGTRPTSSR